MSFSPCTPPASCTNPSGTWRSTSTRQLMAAKETRSSRSSPLRDRAIVLFWQRPCERQLHCVMDFSALCITWTAMMIAMMLPAVLPYVFVFATEQRRRRAQNVPHVKAGIFLAGYLVAWTPFSVFAAALQQALHRGALLSPMMAATSSTLAGGLLIAAGIYRWTPMKGACLKHCRSPLAFFLSDWRDRSPGAHGRRALPLLHRVLLAPPAPPIRRRSYEPAVDGRPHGLALD